MKLVTVVGARPQFVKASQVSSALRDHADIREVLVHTGQHYDHGMSGIFFQQLQMGEPDYHLGVGSGTHGAQTGTMLTRIEEVLLKERPDLLLVYGDTNSTLAGALAAAKLHIPVAHVEAGLRSFNRRMPEEVNRVVTDSLSTVLFAPTEAAVANLRREGVPDINVENVGDVMYDAALNFAHKTDAAEILAQAGLQRKNYLLATIHRAENTDDPERLAGIVDSLRAASDIMPILLPLHPRTRNMLQNLGFSARLGSRVKLVEPVGYFEMLALEQGAAVILTDSGGVQKEAYFFRVPCVTLRRETEWVELVESGWNHLVGNLDGSALVQAIAASLQPARTRTAEDLYGGGAASRRIVERIARQFSC